MSEPLDDGLDKDFTEMCDVKQCGNPGAGYLQVGNKGKIWLCLEHEL